jgi:hypothetical protein
MYPAGLHRPRVLVSNPTVDGWDADDGPTDIDKLTLACGPDNRMVEQGGWITRKRKDGRIEWIPPPHRDWGHLPLAGDGQARVNKYHHPEEFLVPEGRRSVARANPLYRIFIERLGEAYRASEGS